MPTARGSSTGGLGTKASRMINESPHLASDLLDAPREVLVLRALEARRIAEGATSTLATAMLEIERLEALLGIDDDDDDL